MIVAGDTHTPLDRVAMVIKIDRTAGFESRQTNMIKTAFWNAETAPAVNGGKRAFGEARYGSCAAESIDQSVCGSIHECCLRQSQTERNRKSAIMAVATIAERLLMPRMTPAEIRAELARRNMTIRDLAEATGIVENYLTKSLNIRSEKPRKIQAAELDAIRRIFADDVDTTDTVRLRKIPLYGTVPAGKVQPVEQHTGRWHAVSDPETPPRAYALTVEGDSMDLVVPNGATLIIDPDDTDLWPNRHYVIMNEDGQTTFKEFQDNPARFVPVSSNDMHEEIRLGAGIVKILGSVFSYTLRTPPRRGGLARTGGSRRSQQDS